MLGINLHIIDCLMTNNFLKHTTLLVLYTLIIISENDCVLQALSFLTEEVVLRLQQLARQN